MTKEQSVLETMRDNAQKLREKIAGTIAKTDRATWNDVLVVQQEALALATDMREISDEQSDTAKAAIKSAIARLEVAGRRVKSNEHIGTEEIKHANADLLSSCLSAAHGLSLAATNIEPGS